MTQQREMPPFGRVLTAMATPFTEDGDVDYAQAADLARYLVAHGSDGLAIAGTTGESATLTTEEKLRLFQTIKEAVGDSAKVLAGTGGNDTAAVIALSKEAIKTAVDGLLIVTPGYNRPSQEGLYQHFRAIAEACPDAPIMLYNVPTRTSVNLESQTVVRLAEIENIVALKEAGPLIQVGEVVARARQDFAVYSGADEMNLAVLTLGGVGVVSVIAHIVGPDLKKMHQAFFAGDLATARALHLKTLPMTHAMFSFPSPVPTKTALVLQGVLPHRRVRLPLVDATDAERTAIANALQTYGCQ